jgi:small subunit ribosomal protein S20
MPRRKSSIKRTRADRKKHLRNLRIKRLIKETIKRFLAQTAAKNISEAKTLLHKAYRQLDKAAKKNVIHPNTAKRKKSRLTLRFGKIR